MTNQQREIYEYLKRHVNGMRVRNINLPYSRVSIVMGLSELQKMGLVSVKRVSDAANLEYYEKWFVR